MKETFAFILFVFLSDIQIDFLSIKHYGHPLDRHNQDLCNSSVPEDCYYNEHDASCLHTMLLAEAKGVAGLGKAGSESQGGSDKAGQQVPPEVYIALTYAGTAFLFTLSVPLILYGLNKLLNKIEDCFGCGPSSKMEKTKIKQEQQQQQQQQQANSNKSNNSQEQFSPLRQQFHQNQQLHQQLMRQQYSKNHRSHAFASLTSNGNNGIQSNPMITSNHKQAPSPTTNMIIPSSCAITLPFDSEINYKTSTTTNSSTASQQHQNYLHNQQPFIISSPQI